MVQDELVRHRSQYGGTQEHLKRFILPSTPHVFLTWFSLLTIEDLLPNQTFHTCYSPYHERWLPKEASQLRSIPQVRQTSFRKLCRLAKVDGLLDSCYGNQRYSQNFFSESVACQVKTEKTRKAPNAGLRSTVEIYHQPAGRKVCQSCSQLNLGPLLTAGGMISVSWSSSRKEISASPRDLSVLHQLPCFNFTFESMNDGSMEVGQGHLRIHTVLTARSIDGVQKRLAA